MENKRPTLSYSMFSGVFLLALILVSCVQGNFEWNSNAFLPAQDNLLIHWDFDRLNADNNCVNLADSNTYTGTRGYSSTSNSDPFFNGLGPDGSRAAVFSGEEFVFTDGENIEVDEEFSVSFWLNPQAPTPTSGNALVFMGTPSLNWQISYLHGIGTIPGNYKNVCLIYNTITTACIDGIKIREDEWQHIAFSVRRQNSDLFVTAYLNGELQDAPAPSSPNNFTPDAPIYLGAKEGTHYLYKGKMDNFIFWDTELSSEEICDVYTIQSGGLSCGISDDAAGSSPSLGPASSSSSVPPTGSSSSSEASSSSSSELSSSSSSSS